MRQNALLVAAAVLVAAGLAGARELTRAEPPPARSDKTSPCGQVGLPAEDLGLESTRVLTLCLLNERRARAGLAALRYDGRLEASSQAHSEDMVGRGFFEHQTPEGVEPYSRMLAAGYAATNALTGENIAWGEGAESSPAEIMDSWMRSPPHREAILNPQFVEVGVGMALGAPRPNRDRAQAATYTTNFGGPPIR